MNIQGMIVGIVMMVCVAWIVRRTILCIRRIRHKDNPCEGCPCGCNKGRKNCSNEKK